MTGHDRLPVKSLVRFKCVCKSWCSSISESKFVKTHLKKAIEDVNAGGHRLLLPTTTPQLIQSINYEAAAENNGDNNTISSVSLDFVTDCSSKYAPSVSGSCNGLVCVIGPELQITLWNPCTRDARTLPKPASRSYTSCGLGYDSSSDDYKVVLANSFILVDDRIDVEVFSLRRNTWKMVEDIHPRRGRIFSKRPAFLNGALHWVANCGTGELIFSFDLVTEKLQELVPFPPAQGTFFSVGCLFVLDGCVSAVSRRRRDISFAHEIWVMKEYGVEASWTKILFTICIPHSCCYLVPVCFSKNGELLVNVGGTELKMYNPKAMTLRDIDIPGKCRWSAMVPYVESLVSPNDFH